MSAHPWTVIIGERGWIFAGRVHRDGDRVVIEDAYIVRRYSLETKDGLGGLALRGPRKDNDVLDASPTIRVGVMLVLGDIECPDQDAWSKWHSARVSKAAK